MTDAEALAIFKAGQRFLEALHPHLDDRGLETFDMHLAELYEEVGLDHELCGACDADTPTQIMKDGVCPECREMMYSTEE